MEDVLSKEHYCYKIYTLSMKGIAYPPFYRQPPFLQENLDLPPPSIFPNSHYDSHYGSHTDFIIKEVLWGLLS